MFIYICMQCWAHALAGYALNMAVCTGCQALSLGL